MYPDLPNKTAVARSTAATGLPKHVTDNRKAMPHVAAAVDALRAVFGELKVIYAEEGGQARGKQPPAGLIPCFDNFVKQPKAEKAAPTRRRRP